MDGFNRRADFGARRQAQQKRAAPIFSEFELDPGVKAGDVDAGDQGGPLLVANGEAPVVQKREPRLTVGRFAGRHEGIHGRAGFYALTAG